jgi:hypoxanthine-DNA glycosylase
VSAPLAHGFAPLGAADARVLILGTLPGRVSLERREYYAQRRNAFWRLMGELFDAGPEHPYAERGRRLREGGIALWDVCAAAARPGSLDAAIERASIVANDFKGFFDAHRRIELIACNGATAAALYRRHVVPGLPADVAALPLRVLPSTSPAHAAMPYCDKRARWQAALGAPSR